MDSASKLIFLNSFSISIKQFTFLQAKFESPVPAKPEAKKKTGIPGFPNGLPKMRIKEVGLHIKTLDVLDLTLTPTQTLSLTLIVVKVNWGEIGEDGYKGMPENKVKQMHCRCIQLHPDPNQIPNLKIPPCRFKTAPFSPQALKLLSTLNPDFNIKSSNYRHAWKVGCLFHNHNELPAEKLILTLTLNP